MCTETQRKRAWSDPQMYTHLAFVPGVLVALQREPVMLELVVLQCIVCVLSLWYHRNYEHECGMAKVEHAFAHALFVYGWIQMLRSPGVWTFLANMACAGVTLGVYVLTNENKELWERWHAIGLHVVPGIWSLIIASYHEAMWDIDVSDFQSAIVVSYEAQWEL
jgi:hypothetical protein